MAQAVLLLPPLTEQYNSSQRDFQEFLGQIIGKLLGLFCVFFKYIVLAHEWTCDSGGSMPPGNTTLPMEKSQLDVNRNILFRLMAEIQLYQIQQQWSDFFFHRTLESNNSEQLKLQ